MALVRGNGSGAVEVSMADAVEAAAAGLGPHADDGTIAVAGGCRLTNEEARALMGLGRSVLGTSHVGSFGLEREGPIWDALGRSFGRPGSTASFKDVLGAEVILLIDSDIAEEQTVAGIAVRKAVRLGARLFVLSSERTRMAKLAEGWIAAPRADHGSALALMLEVAAPGGKPRVELPYEVSGLDELLSSVGAGAPDVATGEIAREAAEAFASAEKAVVIANAMSFEPATARRDATLAVALAVVTGKSHADGSGVLFLGRARTGRVCPTSASPSRPVERRHSGAPSKPDTSRPRSSWVRTPSAVQTIRSGYERRSRSSISSSSRTPSRRPRRPWPTSFFRSLSPRTPVERSRTARGAREASSGRSSRIRACRI